MFPDIKLTLIESLQFSSFILSVFLTIYLIAAIKNKSFSVIPACYFFSISCGLLISLIPAFFNVNNIAGLSQINPGLTIFLLMSDGLMPAISFLLIIQMSFNAVPRTVFWAILLLPGIGTFISNLIVCSNSILCFPSSHVIHLNRALVSAFTFMLLTIIFSCRSSEIKGGNEKRNHKYWLIICLIIYNIILISIDISAAAEFITEQKYNLSNTLIKIAFIYITITSIFRVFDDHFELNSIRLVAKNTLTEYEKSVGCRAEKILNNEKPYRDLKFNRANFAKKLGVREHVLSRIINLHFKKSFSELANTYRVNEAKELLRNTGHSITAISYDVGFKSIPSFNRVFKELTGISPSEFREKDGKNDVQKTI